MTVNFWRGASKSTSQRSLMRWVRPRVKAPHWPLQYLVSLVLAMDCASCAVMGATQPASIANGKGRKRPPWEKKIKKYF